jgi:hypothetical protein
MLINAVVQGQCCAAILKNSEILRWGYDDSVFHFPSSRHWGIIMSNIHLTLSSKKPWDTTSYQTPEGQVIYEVESATPIPGARNIKISRMVPSLSFDNETTTKGGEAENLRDSFAHLATVKYHRSAILGLEWEI